MQTKGDEKFALGKKNAKKIAEYYGKGNYDYFDDIIDSLLIPCGVSAVTAFIVTLILL